MMNDLQHRLLLTLRDVTSTALAEAKTLRRRDEDAGEPINWNDLTCVRAAYVITDVGEPYFSVTIGNAVAGSTAISSIIREYLEQEGWKDVEVVVMMTSIGPDDVRRLFTTEEND